MTQSVPENTIALRHEFPTWAGALFRPSRYKVAYGGRGGSKSYSYARALLLKALESKVRILCTREFQASIADSVHKLLSDQIVAMELDKFFTVQQASIFSDNGSEFLFYGLRNNVTKLKSLEGVSYVWCEEAEKISDNSWSVLIPTIRKAGSEIWVSFNPDEETDPTYKRFLVNTPPDCLLMHVGFADNPWFPDVLRKERDYLRSVDPDAYAHIWLGECRKHSLAQVLNGKWIIESFEPEPRYWHGPYFGADWGFSSDPTALIKLWVHEKRLYVEHEVWALGLDIDKTPAAFDAIPDARRYTIRADSARPETISYMQRHGYERMTGVEKWKGSVEDGIAYLRSFDKIVIHPRCTHTIDEARLWSYKVDKLTGDVLPDLIEAHDHLWDASRYSLTPMIRRGFFAGDDLDLS